MMFSHLANESNITVEDDDLNVYSPKCPPRVTNVRPGARIFRSLNFMNSHLRYCN